MFRNEFGLFEYDRDSMIRDQSSKQLDFGI